MQQEIAKGDVLYRTAGIGFIAGAIMLVVFFALHPIIEDPSDRQGFMQTLTDAIGGRWEAIQVIRMLGLLALLAGFVGVYRSIATGGAAAWARFGF